MWGLPGTGNGPVLALALSAALIYAAYVPVISELERGRAPLAMATYMSAGAAIILLVAGAVMGDLTLTLHRTAWIAILLLGLDIPVLRRGGEVHRLTAEGWDGAINLPKLSEELYRSARWLRVFACRPLTVSREALTRLGHKCDVTYNLAEARGKLDRRPRARSLATRGVTPPRFVFPLQPSPPPLLRITSE